MVIRSSWPEASGSDMGLGILEPADEQVPGTVLLDETKVGDESAIVIQSANLKHDTGKNAHVVLAPQPSDEPDDPLNWSKLTKEVVLLQISFGMLLHVCIPSGLITPALEDLSVAVNMPIAKMSQLTGYQLLATACGAYKLVIRRS